MLVGRDDELDRLAQALQRAAGGVTTLVTVEGESGIGKSSVLEWLIERSSAAGFASLRASGDEFERARPFGPLLDALGIRAGATTAAGDAPSAPARHLVEELLRSSPTATTPIVLASVPDLRHRTIEALCGLIEQLALDRAVAVVIDDLHWADPSTLLALRTVARRLEGYRLLIVAASRPPDPSVEREWRHVLAAATDTITLHPLAGDAVSALAASHVGSAPGPNLRTLLQSAGGNPLLLVELFRDVRDWQLQTGDDGSLDVPVGFLPGTLTASVERRLRSAAPLTVMVLRAASVLGTTARLGDVCAMVELSAPRVLPAIDEGIRYGLLSADGPDVSFRHDTIRAAVESLLPPVMRSALHEMAATVLMGRRAAAASVASHLEAAGGDDETVLRSWLRRAATEAIGRSPLVAHRLLERARASLAPGSSEWIDIAVDQLEASANAGMLAEAVVLGEELIALDLPPDRRAAVRWWLGGALFLRQRTLEAAELFATAAQDFTKPGDRALLVAYSAMARMTSFSPSAHEWVDRSVDAAERTGDPRAQALALSLHSRMTGMSMRFREAVEPALRAVDIADSDATQAAHRFQPSFFLAIALLDVDRPDEALAAARSGRERADAVGATWAEPLYQGLLAMLHYQSGRDEEADAEATAGLAATEETGSGITILWCHGVLALLALSRGRTNDARSAVEAGEAAFAAGQGQLGLDLLALARSRLLDLDGDPGRALVHLVEHWALFEAAGVTVGNASLVIDITALAMRTGAMTEAHRAADAAHSWTVLDRGSARLAALSAACASLVAGRSDALAGIADALAAAGWVADAAGLVGRMPSVLQVPSPTLPSAPRSLSPSSSTPAVLRVLTVEPGSVPKGPLPASALVAGWERLSPAEQRVCLAVGRGLSNKAIAAELYLSTRTVETHVSRILRKMDVASRLKLGLLVRPILDESG